MIILNMTKPACATCGKVIDIWILPEAESGPFYCGEECRNEKVREGVVEQEVEGSRPLLVAGTEGEEGQQEEGKEG